MATPNQLIQKDKDAYVNMPGIDPITPQTFAQPQAQAAQAPTDDFTNPYVAPQEPEEEPNDTEEPMPQAQAPIVSPAQVPASLPIPEFKTTPLSIINTPRETGPIFSEYIKQSDEADRALMTANVEKAQVHQQAAEEQRLSLQHSDQEWAAAQTEQAKREKAMDEAIAKGRAMSIDPQRYWNRQGTGANILAAISVGLGAFGSGMTHGATGNPGMALINQAIEHDISAQKSDIDSYWHSVQQQFQLDNNVLNRALVNQNFRANQRLAANKLVDSELAAIEAKSANPMVQKGAADMRMQLEMKQVALRQQSAVAIAELERQKAAAQAAGFARKDKDAKERNAQVVTLTQSYVQQGYDPSEANNMAWRDADKMYPQLANTQFASPGQKYDATKDSVAAQYAMIQQGLNNKNPQLAAKAKDTTIQIFVQQGMSKEDAEKKVNAIKNASSSAIKSAADVDLTNAGITNPYSTGGSSSSPLVVNNPANPGQSFRFPSKEAAKEYNDRSSAIYQFAQDADELIKLRQQHGGGFSTILNPDDAKKEEQIRQRMAGTWAKANGGGNALSDKEFDRAMALIPQASSYGITSDPGKQLQELKQLVLQKQVANAEGLGGKPYGSSTTAAPMTGTTNDRLNRASQAVTNTSKDPFTPYSSQKVPAAPITGPIGAKATPSAIVPVKSTGPVGPGPVPLAKPPAPPTGPANDDWINALDKWRQDIDKGGK